MPRVNWFERRYELRGHVKDQVVTLYCWAIVIAFVVGARNLILNNINGRSWMFSAQDLIDNVIRLYYEDLPEGVGASIDDDNSYAAYAATGLKYCTYEGLAYESEYPYTGKRNSRVSQKKFKRGRVYIERFEGLGCSSEGPEQKDRIYEGVDRGPVIGTIKADDNFSLWRGNKIIEPEDLEVPEVSTSAGDKFAEHAVAVIGMDTDAEIYEIQNSEGKKWAVEGVGSIRCDLVYDIVEPIGPRSTPYYPKQSAEEENEELSKEESEESEDSEDEEWGKPAKRQRKNLNPSRGREIHHGKKPPGVRKTLLEVTSQVKSSISLLSNLEVFYTRGLGAHLAHDVPNNHYLPPLSWKVLISHVVSSCGVNCALMEQLAKLYKRSHLWKSFPAYDGRKSFYTAGPLTLVKKEFKIVLPDENDGLGTTSLICRRERTFKVVIKFASSRADVHYLQMLIEENWADTPQGALLVVDIILGERPTARRRRLLDEGLESWRGFCQRMRPTHTRLSLNTDMSSIVFIEPLHIIEFAPQRLNRDVTFRPLSDAGCVKVNNSSRGVKVEVLHSEMMCRNYRISDLTSQLTRELMFPDDERDTVKGEYVRNTSDVVLKHIQLPYIQVRNQPRPINLPKEVSKILEGQRYVKRLNEKQITALFEGTCPHPSQRESSILQVQVICGLSVGQRCQHFSKN